MANRKLVSVMLAIVCLASVSSFVDSEPLSKRDTFNSEDRDDSDLNNILYPYTVKRASDERIRDNVIIANTFGDLERESSSSETVPQQKSFIPTQTGAKQEGPIPAPTIQQGDSKTPSQASTLDKAKSISFNSREVRLVGSDQKEVEMKDDIATKVVIAMENIQKDASELWDQVNERLDKGWTDLKTMIEKAVAPSNAKSGSATGRKF